MKTVFWQAWQSLKKAIFEIPVRKGLNTPSELWLETSKQKSATQNSQFLHFLSDF